MRNLTYVFGSSGILGILLFLASLARWAIGPFFFGTGYQDISQAIMGGVIGIGWAIMSFGFGYMYEQIRYLKDKHKSLEFRLDSLIQDNRGRDESNSWKNAKKK